MYQTNKHECLLATFARILCKEKKIHFWNKKKSCDNLIIVLKVICNIGNCYSTTITFNTIFKTLKMYGFVYFIQVYCCYEDNI